jgi:glutathione-regulated potassium-efflux system ancillary protein KefC
MSLSFALAAPLNKFSHLIFDRYKAFILKINKHHGTEDQTPLSIDGAEIMVVGMGSIGKPTYDKLREETSYKLLGLDYSTDNVAKLKGENYQVKWADATDSEFWEKIDASSLKMVFLCMSDFVSNQNILVEIQKCNNKKFKVCSVTDYPDKKEDLMALGADFVYYFKEYVGQNFVIHSMDQFPDYFENQTKTS